MPKTMKATVFVEPRRIELREKAVPEVGPLDALLRAQRRRSSRATTGRSGKLLPPSQGLANTTDASAGGSLATEAPPRVFHTMAKKIRLSQSLV